MKRRTFDMNEMRTLIGLGVVAEAEEGGNGGTDGAIKALRDTDYRDKDAYFKMVQILKGLAAGSEDDKKSKEFLDAVSDALTTAAKKVLGESVTEADEQKKKTLDGNRFNLKHCATRCDEIPELAKRAARDFRGDASLNAVNDIIEVVGVCRRVLAEFKHPDYPEFGAASEAIAKGIIAADNGVAKMRDNG